MERYAIYLRKSREDVEKEKLGEGETLARHKKILTELAQRRGLHIGKIYQEIISGAETIADRKEIQQLIYDCYAGLWRGILVTEVSRFSRGNQGDAQQILDCLRYGNNNNGILVITPSKVYDVANNHDDSEYMEFELFMSRREYKMIKRRMDAGKDQAIIDGDYMGSYRPYGYDILKTQTARTLIPNPDEAPIVKDIFKWFTKENLSPRKIAERLDAMGVPTYTGASEWSTSTIKTILNNPTYIGKVRWNDRMQVRKMVDGKIIKSRPRSNHSDKYMEIDGKHKKYALIDEETFKAASSRFFSDKTKSNLTLNNPLAGLLRCKCCGHVMIHQAYKSKPTVLPRYVHRQSTKCSVKSVYASDVMDAVVQSLKLYIEDFEIRVDNKPTIDEREIMEQLEALQERLSQTKKKLNKMFDDYENGIYTTDEFVERKTLHNSKIESIQKQIEHLKNSLPEHSEYHEKIIMLSEALDSLLDNNIPATVKNEYLKRIIDRIDFSRESDDDFVLDIYLKQNRTVI